jgi:hypothetical protein
VGDELAAHSTEVKVIFGLVISYTYFCSACTELCCVLFTSCHLQFVLVKLKQTFVLVFSKFTYGCWDEVSLI